jgi:hypothetical protein
LTNRPLALFSSIMAAASLHALLARSIDYAGMFPPCSLALKPALENQAQYVRASDSWMLGAFVLPIAKFDAAAASLSQFDQPYPLRISALGAKTENSNDFRSALKMTMETIRSFAARHGDLVSISQLEMPLPAGINADLLAEAQSIIGELDAFWETPADEAAQTIAALAVHHANTLARTFGYKLRTGGVTADAFPHSQQIARALVESAKHDVPIKFTAGLHHPVRQFRDEVKAKMYGFLNVLGAGVLAAEYRWDEKQTAAMLDDEDTTSFSFDDDGFTWREWKIDPTHIVERRKLVTSFGSCSFDEPREDLRALKFL